MNTMIGGGVIGGRHPEDVKMGRALSDKFKLQGQGLPEIRQALMHAAADLNVDESVREAARGAVTTGNLVVAFILWCLTRPEPELVEIAAWGLRALERLKDSGVPLDLRKMDRDDFGSLGGVPDTYQDDTSTKRRPKGASMRPGVGGRTPSKKTG